MVWPSIFAPPTATQRSSVELALPEWVGVNTPFWDDLNALRTAIPEDYGGKHPYWVIAATWHTDTSFADEGKREGKMLGPYPTATTPRRRETGWRFLGFDVADPGISGLTNCGYDPIERDTLAGQFGHDLNRFHLFDDIDRAFEFRTITSARVPEHAPFFVIGLWLIEATAPA
jgi:hypothetical protein